MPRPRTAEARVTRSTIQDRNRSLDEETISSEGKDEPGLHVAEQQRFLELQQQHPAQQQQQKVLHQNSRGDHWCERRLGCHNIQRRHGRVLY